MSFHPCGKRKEVERALDGSEKVHAVCDLVEYYCGNEVEENSVGCFAERTLVVVDLCHLEVQRPEKNFTIK